MTIPQPAPMPQPGDVVAEKYLVERLLGEGGMGAVYQAVHQVTGKRVALKWMQPALGADPEASARFLREAQVAGRLEHPNIVDVHDVGSERGSMYLVMELLQGETLADLLDRGRLPPAEAIRLLMPVFRAIAAAHSAQIVHRDLKPENIFLCRDSDGRALEAKVLDFGVSKLLDTPEALKLTRTGTIVGTLFYMAPEQVTAQPVGPTADVFALGVILYQAITGLLPWDARNFNALIVEVATKPAIPMKQRMPELDEALDLVVLRALERNPIARFQDVAAFARELERFAPGVQFTLPQNTWRLAPAAGAPTSPAAPAPTTGTTLDLPTTLPSRLLRSLAWAVAAVFLLAGAGTAAWIVVRSRADGSPSESATDAAALVPASLATSVGAVQSAQPAPAVADLGSAPPATPAAGAPSAAGAPIVANQRSTEPGGAAETPPPAQPSILPPSPSLSATPTPPARGRRSTGERPREPRRAPRTSSRIRVEDF